MPICYGCVYMTSCMCIYIYMYIYNDINIYICMYTYNYFYIYICTHISTVHLYTRLSTPSFCPALRVATSVKSKLTLLQLAAMSLAHAVARPR